MYGTIYSRILYNLCMLWTLMKDKYQKVKLYKKDWIFLFAGRCWLIRIRFWYSVIVTFFCILSFWFWFFFSKIFLPYTISNASQYNQNNQGYDYVNANTQTCGLKWSFAKKKIFFQISISLKFEIIIWKTKNTHRFRSCSSVFCRNCDFIRYFCRFAYLRFW